VCCNIFIVSNRVLRIAAAATTFSSCEEPINYIKNIKVVGHDLKFSCFLPHLLLEKYEH